MPLLTKRRRSVTVNQRTTRRRTRYRSRDVRPMTSSPPNTSRLIEGMNLGIAPDSLEASNPQDDVSMLPVIRSNAIVSPIQPSCHNLGVLEVGCSYCHAMCFKNERTKSGRGPFTKCCGNGSVSLPPLPTPIPIITS